MGFEAKLCVAKEFRYPFNTFLHNEMMLPEIKSTYIKSNEQCTVIYVGGFLCNMSQSVFLNMESNCNSSRVSELYTYIIISKRKTSTDNRPFSLMKGRLIVDEFYLWGQRIGKS